MDDFAIRVKNLPKDFMFERNEDHLKACLISHFESIIKEEMKKDTENEENTTNLEICEIKFGTASMKDTEFLSNLSVIREEYIKNKIRHTILIK
jgi:hypothetical protein